MIKLFKVKEKQRELAENANGKTPVKKQSAGELRLHKGYESFFIFYFNHYNIIGLVFPSTYLSICYEVFHSINIWLMYSEILDPHAQLIFYFKTLLERFLGISLA